MSDREQLTLKFETMTQGGEALARQDNGRVVFVPLVIAGETARIEITEAHRGFARGRVLEILDPSPHRVTPPCPHFPPSPLALFSTLPVAPVPTESEADVASSSVSSEANGPSSSVITSEANLSSYCGGCQWQHIAYPAQRDFKTQIVRDQFARVAKMPDAPVLPILPAAREWHYRNHMQFAVAEDGALCLRAPDSHTLVPIRECWIMDAPLTEMFKTLELDGESFNSVSLRAGENTGEKFLILESDDPETPEIETDDPVSIAFRTEDVTIPILGNEFLHERVGDLTFRISPDSFFQVNTPMAQTLVVLVIGALAPRPDDILLDGYGGVGLFGISLADRVAEVIEVEENPEAIEDAQINAQAMPNVSFLAGRMEDVLPQLDTHIDLAVIDPPRVGLERAALDALAAKRPRTIAYVSCDTATLARDIARFVERGYRLDSVQPVDLFPQTYHIECVARLVLL